MKVSCSIKTHIIYLSTTWTYVRLLVDGKMREMELRPEPITSMSTIISIYLRTQLLIVMLTV